MRRALAILVISVGLSAVGVQELMSIKVTSVQRRERKLAHSAAAVPVITREDIRRAGFSNLQEALLSLGVSM